MREGDEFVDWQTELGAGGVLQMECSGALHPDFREGRKDAMTYVSLSHVGGRCSLTQRDHQVRGWDVEEVSGQNP